MAGEVFRVAAAHAAEAGNADFDRHDHSLARGFAAALCPDGVRFAVVMA